MVPFAVYLSVPAINSINSPSAFPVRFFCARLDAIALQQ